MLPIDSHLIGLIAATWIALGIGSLIRCWMLRNAPPEKSRPRMASLKVWWILTWLWSLAVCLGKPGMAALLLIAGLLGLREFARLLGSVSDIGWPSVVAMLICAVIHYAWILTDQTSLAFWWFPIFSLMLIGGLRSIRGRATDFLRLTAGWYWGGMLLIYALSCSLNLVDFARTDKPWVGITGWFLYLLLLTEINDIAQAVVGRQWGRTRVTPVVSPNKTWEGLCGGVVVCSCLAIGLAPWLTTWFVDRPVWQGVVWALISGLIISISGFLGDIQMSAIKREAGVKDGSRLLPGMGGMIDRVDSLTFSGPAFYYFVLLIHCDK